MTPQNIVLGSLLFFIKIVLLLIYKVSFTYLLPFMSCTAWCVPLWCIVCASLLLIKLVTKTFYLSVCFLVVLVEEDGQNSKLPIITLYIYDAANPYNILSTTVLRYDIIKTA